MTGELIYELEGVSYSYLGRFPALRDIDLKIRRGEASALLGANGSGKSTLLMILSGLVFPDKGVVRFLDREVKEASFQDAVFQRDFRSRVGIVFQNSDIQLFNSNVEDEILFGLLQLGLPEKELSARLERYITLMDIGHLRARHPQYMSAGEKKCVAIASVLAMEPEVLVLDEPTSGLDPRTTRHLIDTISALRRKGYTIITATQDIHIISEIADRAVILSEDKRVVMDKDIYEALRDKAFLEAHNLIHAHAHVHTGLTHIHPHEHPSHDHSH